tara:strand:+ start:1452 stop:2930 length:1479 start_codon:yes stop_codon:yes gene_type:complete
MALTTVPVELASLDGAVTVNESSADADFRVESNGNANMLFVDGGNNRVGIGEGSPDTLLMITGDAAALTIEDNGSYSADSVSSFIGFNGQDAAGSNRDLAYINVGQHAGGNGTGSIDFQTRIAGTVASRLKIDSAGNVGIGRSNPTVALTVDPAANVTTSFGSPLVQVGGNNSWGGNGSIQSIGFGYIDSTVPTKSPGEIGFVTTDNSGHTKGALVFATRNVDTDTAPSERVRVRQDGNVGIGSVGMPVYSGYTQLSVGPMAHIMAENTSGAGRSLHISQNAHLDTDGSWETMETDEASNYYQHNGGHYWRVAPNATSAGTDITWKTAAYINNIGQIIMGASDHADDVLYLSRSGTGKLLRFYSDGSEVGYISTNTYSLPSDRNFKKDIEDLTLGLDFVKDLKPKQYRQKTEDSDVPLQTGLIAQDVEESLTAAGVSKNKYMMLQHTPNDEEGASQYGIDYGKLIPVLINAIQEQQEVIETLQTKVKALEGA